MDSKTETYNSAASQSQHYYSDTKWIDWTTYRLQTAKEALGGLLSNPHKCQYHSTEELAEIALTATDYLIKKLQEGGCSKIPEVKSNII